MSVLVLMNYPALDLRNILCISAQGTGLSTGSSKEGEEDATWYKLIRHEVYN